MKAKANERTNDEIGWNRCGNRRQEEGNRRLRGHEICKTQGIYDNSFNKLDRNTVRAGGGGGMFSI